MRTLGCTNRTMHLGARDAKKYEPMFKFDMKGAASNDIFASPQNSTYAVAAGVTQLFTQVGDRGHRTAGQALAYVLQSAKPATHTVVMEFNFYIVDQPAEGATLIPYWDIVYGVSGANTRFTRFTMFRNSAGVYSVTYAEHLAGTGQISGESVATNISVPDGTLSKMRVHQSVLGNRRSLTYMNSHGATDMRGGNALTNTANASASIGVQTPIYFATTATNQSDSGIESAALLFPW